MTIRVEIQGGDVLEFPDGTDDAVIDRTVKNHLGMAAPIAEEAEAAPERRGTPDIPSLNPTGHLFENARQGRLIREEFPGGDQYSPLADTLSEIATERVPHLAAGILERATHLGAGLIDSAADMGRNMEENHLAGGLGGIVWGDGEGLRYVGGDEYRELISPEQEILEQLAARGREVDIYEPAFTPEMIKEDYRQGNYASMLGNALGFGGEQFITSLPDMVAAISNLPVYVQARTGELSQERAKELGMDQPGGLEVAAGGGAATVSALLEKFGAEKVFGGSKAGEALYKTILRGAASETITEFPQEVVEYTGTKAGTGNFSLAEALEQGGWGALGGAVGGGGMTTIQGLTDRAVDPDRPERELNALADQFAGLQEQLVEAVNKEDTKAEAKIRKQLDAVAKEGQRLLGMKKRGVVELPDERIEDALPEGQVPITGDQSMLGDAVAPPAETKDNPGLESAPVTYEGSAPITSQPTQIPAEVPSEPQPVSSPAPTPSAVSYDELDDIRSRIFQSESASEIEDIIERINLPVRSNPQTRTSAFVTAAQRVLEEISDESFAYVSDPANTREQQIEELTNAIAGFDEQLRVDVSEDMLLVTRIGANESATPEAIATRIVDLFHGDQNAQARQETDGVAAQEPTQELGAGQEEGQPAAGQQAPAATGSTGQEPDGDGTPGPGQEAATQGRAETEAEAEAEYERLRSQRKQVLDRIGDPDEVPPDSEEYLRGVARILDLQDEMNERFPDRLQGSEWADWDARIKEAAQQYRSGDTGQLSEEQEQEQEADQEDEVDFGPVDFVIGIDKSVRLPKEGAGQIVVDGLGESGTVKARVTRTGNNEYKIEFSNGLEGRFGKGPESGFSGSKSKWYERGHKYGSWLEDAEATSINGIIREVYSHVSQRQEAIDDLESESAKKANAEEIAEQKRQVDVYLEGLMGSEFWAKQDNEETHFGWTAEDLIRRQYQQNGAIPDDAQRDAMAKNKDVPRAIVDQIYEQFGIAQVERDAAEGNEIAIRAYKEVTGKDYVPAAEPEQKTQQGRGTATKQLKAVAAEDEQSAIDLLYSASQEITEAYINDLLTRTEEGPPESYADLENLLYGDEQLLDEVAELLNIIPEPYNVPEELYRIASDNDLLPEVEFDENSLEDMGSLASTDVPAHTGTAPEPASPNRPEPGANPLAAVARRRQKRRAAQRERKTPPPVAPKRERVEASPYDKLFYDLTGGDEVYTAKLMTMPIDEQLAWAKRVIKSRYGFREIRINPKMADREAMDILLDAYQNLNNLSAIAGIRSEAIGFEGNLILNIEPQIGRSKGTRGMFSWSYADGFEASTLSLARRADSFAHEWFHALDMYLQMYNAMVRQEDGSYKYNRKALTLKPVGGPSAAHGLGATGQSKKGTTPRREVGVLIDDAMRRATAALFFTSDPQPILEMKGRARNLTAAKDADERAVKRITKRMETREKWMKQAEESHKRFKRLFHEAEERITRSQVGSQNREKAARAAEHNRAGMQRKADEISDLKKEIAGLRQEKGKLDARIKEADEQIKTLNKDAEELTKELRSTYAESSEYADKLAGADYFALPAEMFARAGEAYVAEKVKQARGTEFISGSLFHYTKSHGKESKDMTDSELLMSLIYPSELDRARIEVAFDDLFAALGDARVFGTPHRGQEIITPAQETRLQAEVRQRLKETGEEGWVEQSVNALRNDLQAARKAGAMGRRAAASIPGAVRRVSSDGLPGLPNATRDLNAAFSTTFFASARGRLLGLQDKYRDVPALRRELRKIMAKIATDPGSGDAQARTIEEDADLLFKQGMNRMTNLLNSFNVKEEDYDLLREMLVRPYESQMTEAKGRLQEAEEWLAEIKEQIGENPKGAAKKKLQKAIAHKAAVQRYHDDVASKLRGFHERVDAADPGLAKAAQGIRKIMDDQWVMADDSGINMGYTRNGYLPRILDNEAIEADRAGFVKKATEAYESMRQSEGYRLRQQIKKKQAELDKIEPGEEGSVEAIKADMMKQRINAEIAELTQELNKWDAFSSLDAANEWLYSLTVNEFFTPDKAGPPQTFARQRTLPPEADIILQDFYQTDPTVAVMQYLQSSSRRIAYAKRFGADNSILNDHTDRLIQLGMDPVDLDLVYDAVRVAVGAYRPTVGAMNHAANWAFHLGNAAMLVRTLFAQIAEPLTVGIRTGNTMDGWRAMLGTIQDLTKRPDARTRRELLELLGITGDILSDQIMHNKMLMTGADSKRATDTMINFFRATGVFGYTMASRRASAGLGQKYMVTWAERLLDPETDKQKQAASRTFAELGVAPRQQEAFAKWVVDLGANPSVDQFVDPDQQAMYTAYATALNRFVDQTIQNPRAVDRPMAAFNPIGRFIFSLTSFAYTFQRNVLLRQIKLTKRDIERGEWDQAGLDTLQYIPAFASLMAGQAVMQLARDAWTDWGIGDEDDEQTRLEKTMERWSDSPVQAFFDVYSRAGGFGGFDPLYQQYTGFKYRRTLQETAAGAIPGYYLGHLNDILAGMMDDAAPNTQEWKAWKSLYELSVGGAMPYLFAQTGASGILSWIGFTKLTSPDAAENFATFMAGGPKGTKTEKGTSKSSGSRNRSRSRSRSSRSRQ